MGRQGRDVGEGSGQECAEGGEWGRYRDEPSGREQRSVRVLYGLSKRLARPNRYRYEFRGEVCPREYQRRALYRQQATGYEVNDCKLFEYVDAYVPAKDRGLLWFKTPINEYRIGCGSQR